MKRFRFLGFAVLLLLCPILLTGCHATALKEPYRQIMQFRLRRYPPKRPLPLEKPLAGKRFVPKRARKFSFTSMTATVRNIWPE